MLCSGQTADLTVSGCGPQQLDCTAMLFITTASVWFSRFNSLSSSENVIMVGPVSVKALWHSRMIWHHAKEAFNLNNTIKL